MTAYGGTTYAYNGDAVRMSKKTSQKTTSYVWGSAGPSGAPLLLVDGSTSYVYGPEGLPLEQISGNTVLYYLHDQLGSTRVLTSSSGAAVATYTYGAYGSVVGTTGTATNPFGFAGGYTDSESGLLYLQHRYYDPATAQFVSVDPEVDAMQSAYGYVSDNPLAAVDLTGLGLFSWAKSAASWVYDHSDTIATVSGAAAVVLAPVPVVGQAAEIISIGSGALAGIHSAREGHYANAVLDFAGAGLGAAGWNYGRITKSIPELSLVGGSQGFMLRADSQGAYLMQYLALHFRDNRALIEYYESLGLSFDAAAAAAAAASQALQNCP
jgi:RHS repeat-associated protein